MDKKRRICKNETCDKSATHALAWNGGWAYYCEDDARTIQQLDDVMGFGLPRSSMRPMTEDEMYLSSVPSN